MLVSCACDGVLVTTHWSLRWRTRDRLWIDPDFVQADAPQVDIALILLVDYLHVGGLPGMID